MYGLRRLLWWDSTHFNVYAVCIFIAGTSIHSTVVVLRLGMQQYTSSMRMFRSTCDANFVTSVYAALQLYFKLAKIEHDIQCKCLCCSLIHNIGAFSVDVVTCTSSTP